MGREYKEQMQMLDIDKALMLYELLKPHLSPDKDQEFVDFIENAINSMKENDPAAYVYCLQVLSGLELDDFEEMNSAEAFGIFSEGLIENNVVGLVKFCESLGL